MKKTSILIVFGLFASMAVNAQKELPVVFELAEDIADWEMFENGGNDVENFVVVDNPDNSGINESASCLKFTVVDNAQPWAGAVSTSFGDLVFTDENHIMKMMVYKNVLSRCLIKVEIKDGDFTEVFVENTVTDEWELLEFDFSAAIGKTYTGLVIFPDFPETRTEGSVNYMDNIGWVEEATSIKTKTNINVTVFPNPSSEIMNVESDNAIGSITIFDLAGKTQASLNSIHNKSAQLNIKNLQPGLYIVTIKDINGDSTSQKLRVQ